MKFGTKADTLQALTSMVKTASALPLFVVAWRDWTASRAEVLAAFRRQRWASAPVIVRSSGYLEDSGQLSSAGQYLTVRDVLGESNFLEAVDRVFASFEDHDGRNQVLVQPYLKVVDASGVAFGIDPDSGAPFATINYSRHPETGHVTDGISEDTETFYWCLKSELPADPFLANVCLLILELSAYFRSSCIDIEFAWVKGKLLLLQARPLKSQHVEIKWAALKERYEMARDQLLSLYCGYGGRVLGANVTAGVMPDWNPAEIIGLRPKTLASSLYRACITDRVWAEQRRDYGYRDLVGVPLMHLIGGQPFINVRASMTSLVPAELSDSLASKLVSYYQRELSSKTFLHDRIEAELVLHCWTFDVNKRLDAIEPLDRAERRQLVNSLHSLTFRILGPNGPWRLDLRRLANLESRLEHRPDAVCTHQRNLAGMLSACRFGARVFAGLARTAFIADRMIRSLVPAGGLDSDALDAYFASIKTVATTIYNDRQTLSDLEFADRYGHLRPGTYDLLMPRYDASAAVTAKTGGRHIRNDDKIFVLDSRMAAVIKHMLVKNSVPLSVEGLFEVAKQAIASRELGKFVYSRLISAILETVAEIGSEYGFAREDCVYIDIHQLVHLDLTTCTGSDFRQMIEDGREDFRNQLPLLPPVVTRTSDLWAFHMPLNHPSFISNELAEGPLLQPAGLASEVAGCIVLLPSADPGYDWMFAAGATGFVTMFGGPNSHMAIRSRELSIPAVMGVGERTFNRLSRARYLRIDCKRKQLTIVD